MHGYNHKEIEKKWQEKWSVDGLYVTPNSVSGKDNEYILVEFPYPSGDLHVGHWYAFAVSDMYARFKQATGKNVMFPIGFDAFGLPAENAAIKNGLNPRIWTEKNMETMHEQFSLMGTMFDPSRKIATCDPDYYKWTQYIFTKFYENDLAYTTTATVQWCPSCKTTLANEQVVSGACERCGTDIEQKEMNQWMLRTTRYAEELITEFDDLEWPEAIKDAQKAWVGKSSGAEITFKVVKEDSEEIVDLPVFTTRPDTLYGVTYAVLAPDHNLLELLRRSIKNIQEVDSYRVETEKKTERDRLEQKEKTGVRLQGIFAKNPLTDDLVPMFIADYVLASYGTGSIMAVPAHDERDEEFAKKFDLEIRSVIDEDGVLINSGEHDGLGIEEAKKVITNASDGVLTNTYRLRDWGVSRQRYWGCPIPIIHCDTCGPVSVPKEQLPVILPEVEDYLPNDEGRSPLSKATDWVNTLCPSCAAPAKRETDTLDTFVDSSWYFLRYTDPNNAEAFADEERIKNWMPVDFYSGGAEHTTMHLLYSRFFVKAMNDCGLIDFREPFKRRLNRGLIIGTDGNKMSKSKGNVINPDEVVERLGADTVRLYLAFIGPYNEPGNYPWDPNGVVGVRRFLERVWRLKDSIVNEESENIKKLLHKTIEKVTNDTQRLKFNTAISTMMTFVTQAEKQKVTQETYEVLLKLLSVFAPHITEELYFSLENKKSIHTISWPTFDETLLKDDTVTIGIQINGKRRADYEFAIDASQDDVENIIKNEVPELKKHLENLEIAKIIYVPGKIVNIVGKPLDK